MAGVRPSRVAAEFRMLPLPGGGSASAVQLNLVDLDPVLVAAWGEAFRPFPEVTVRQADILAVAENAVVSPANCSGFMDGGIDRAYLACFGQQLQLRVQDAIARRPEGHLPVGASLVVRTGHSRIPYLVVAPTMLLPEAVGEDHCFRAMRAVLRLAGRYPEVSKNVFCPGMGTGVGMVPPELAAREMARAYGHWKEADSA
jgi:O-acetyl-ADP-ribose deacetylase (regulator of RNase III)